MMKDKYLDAWQRGQTCLGNRRELSRKPEVSVYHRTSYRAMLFPGKCEYSCRYQVQGSISTEVISVELVWCS